MFIEPKFNFCPFLTSYELSVSLVGSVLAMNFVMAHQALWLEAIERRISATSTMLGSMKGVKMCGLEQTLLRNLHSLRIEELNISKKFRKLLIWNMGFGENIPTRS